MKVIMGIDPGKLGGLAVAMGNKVVAHKLPESERDRLELLREYVEAARIERWPLLCAMELVGGYVGKPQPGSRMFKFGEGYGFLKGVLHTLRVPLVLVRPQEWQRGLLVEGTRRPGRSRVWKAMLRMEAQFRFPHLRVTHHTGDALLILSWAMSRERGTATPTPQ